MPTPYLPEVEACRAAIEAKLLATISNSFRAASDLRLDLGQIAPGTTQIQLKMYVTNMTEDPDSAESDVPVMLLSVTVQHYLSGTEQAYTENTMITELNAQMAPEFWRSIPEVRNIEAGGQPTMDASDVSRNGRVVEYSYDVAVAVQIF